MFVIVAFPVQASDLAPSPKYSTIRFVPPLVVSSPATFRITSFGAVQPESSPVRCTPMPCGCSTSHGKSTITSTASAPPTPQASIPSPPAFGVCESVPIISPPGNA